ncbi:MAG: multicopper oxidase domain-containing protein [Chitinophagaceae bacterium]|nr:multicopper oxidase domain-containing protein [Chitinophagaceae bacterium]
MKPLLIFSTLLILCSCNNNKSSDDSSYKKVYGAPKATVTTQPDNDKQTGPLAYGPNVPKLQDGDTVEVKIDVTHKQFTVKRDVSFGAWLFGDSLPGPVLRVKVGQTIKFSMTDRTNDTAMMKMSVGDHMLKPMPHSIDFHSAMVNPEDKYRTIYPGETIHFTWTANYPGVFMYHCGTPMVLLHMISGMVGMVIVEPADGYPGKVDKEFAIVQNEYYLTPQGATYIADTILALKRIPTYVAFNGKVAQYITRPIRVKAGERIRLYFLNVGPNLISSFHVIGTILDKVWLDGNPANELRGMQAALVGPAQGAVIEFVLPEKGEYTFVDHSFANATVGALGVFAAE